MISLLVLICLFIFIVFDIQHLHVLPRYNFLSCVSKFLKFTKLELTVYDVDFNCVYYSSEISVRRKKKGKNDSKPKTCFDLILYQF